MFHNSQAVLALSLTPNDTMFQKTLALNDFYFGMEGFPYPMGNIQMIGKTLGGMYRAEKPLLTALAPDRALDEIARHAVDFWLTTEDLPEAGQSRRPSIATAASRSPIDPTIRSRCANSTTSCAACSARSDCSRSISWRATSICTTTSPSPVALIRRGRVASAPIPRASVLDRNCKAHELDNLYVVDTSFFVSIGAVNPSLTAIANALRVGDHLLQRLG